MTSALKLTVSGQSDIGVVREENEDSLAIHEPSDPEVRARKGVLVALADGMGGLEDGSTASRMAVGGVARAYYEAPEPPRAALEHAVKEANRAIYRHSQSAAPGRLMGSTLTALVVLDRQACVAQVGDSRAYCYRDGGMHQITRDHSLVRELVDLGRIEESSPHFAFHRNVLTRGLGLRDDVAVDIFELLDLQGGDRILLSSDGLHELLTPEEMASTLERFGSDSDGACRELVRIARDRGGPDNITVAIASFEGEGGARRAREPGLLRRPPGAPRAAGWLLPVALFAGFAAGVVLTLAVEAPGLDGQRAQRIRAEVKEALEGDRSPATDGERASRLKARLEELERILER